ncbi:MAG: hypothetical protein JWQ18_1658 [Conexibacter sp.]|nr:hypothetical protein [Conexibacter sp.]
MSEEPEHQPARCTSCGVSVPVAARFCGTCGAPQESAPVVRTVTPTTGAATVSIDAPRPPALLPAGVPREILVIAGLLAAGGAILLFEALRVLPDVFDVFKLGSLGRALGLLILDLVAFVGAFGAAALVLAWRLLLADRVARGLTYVLSGGTAAAILLGNQHSTGYVLVMLANLAAVAILALTPRVDAFFAAGPASEQPVGVVVARTLLVAWAFCIAITGLIFLPVGTLGTRFVVVGLLLLALGAGAFSLNGGLARGEPTARLIVSIGAAAAAVLTLVVGHSNTGTLLPIALAVGLVASLWGPEDCRTHFAAAARPNRRSPAAG